MWPFINVWLIQELTIFLFEALNIRGKGFLESNLGLFFKFKTIFVCNFDVIVANLLEILNPWISLVFRKNQKF